jgi:gliding motility-associated-like protein
VGVSITECTKNLGNLILNGTTLDVGLAITDPSICGGKDGGLKFSGLSPNTFYDISYQFNGNVETVNNIANNNGEILIEGLFAGAFGDVTVSEIGSDCTAIIGDVELSQPVLNLSFEHINPTSCNAVDGSIIISNAVPNIEYDVEFVYEASVYALNINADINGQIIITDLGVGEYIDILVTDSQDICTQSIEQIELSCTSEFLGCFKIKKFFTPNSDGINDMWHLEIINNCDYTLFIYDRYGKLIDVLTPEDPYWDGSYLGQLMPSSDYWYNIEYTDGVETRTFQSHFALKR